MKLQMMKNNITRFAAKSARKLDKYAPELLLGVGVASIVGGTVMACKATLKMDAILEESKEKIEQINEFGTDDKYEEVRIKNGYTEQDMQKDLTITYVKTAVEIAKNYAPAVGLMIFGLGCIMGSHKIMHRRYTMVVGAYKTLETAYKRYRQNVVDAYGEEVDRDMHLGLRRETVQSEIINEETGRKNKVKEDISVVNPDAHSPYAKFFDELSRNFDKTPGANYAFLHTAQKIANRKLQTNGHLFLNEVYDMLDIPRTQFGAQVGWVLGNGDDYVDFGFMDVHRSQARDFVNQYEKAILLDFNVDGFIVDLI